MLQNNNEMSFDQDNVDNSWNEEQEAIRQVE